LLVRDQSIILKSHLRGIDIIDDHCTWKTRFYFLPIIAVKGYWSFLG